MIITYLLEEHKLTSINSKEAAEKKLKELPLQRLFDMFLEKARDQGREQALNVYQSSIIHSFVDFSYNKIRKGK